MNAVLGSFVESLRTKSQSSSTTWVQANSTQLFSFIQETDNDDNGTHDYATIIKIMTCRRKGGESDQNVVSERYVKCLAEEWGPALVEALVNTPNNPSAGWSNG